MQPEQLWPIKAWLWDLQGVSCGVSRTGTMVLDLWVQWFGLVPVYSTDAGSDWDQNLGLFVVFSKQILSSSCGEAGHIVMLGGPLPFGGTIAMHHLSASVTHTVKYRFWMTTKQWIWTTTNHGTRRTSSSNYHCGKWENIPACFHCLKPITIIPAKTKSLEGCVSWSWQPNSAFGVNRSLPLS